MKDITSIRIFSKSDEMSDEDIENFISVIYGMSYRDAVFHIVNSIIEENDLQQKEGGD